MFCCCTQDDGLPNALADLSEAEFTLHYRTCGRGADASGTKRGGRAEADLPFTTLEVTSKGQFGLSCFV